MESENNKVEEFNPFQIPANIELSLKHQKASKCGTPLEKSELCLCCGREIEQELKKICISPIDLSFLGQGIPLFFQFLQQMTVLIILIFSIFGIYALVTNSISNNCLSNSSQLLKLYRAGFCLQNCPPSEYKDEFKQLTQILQTQDCNTICDNYKEVCIVISSTKIAFLNKQFDVNLKLIQAILVLCCVIIFKIIFLLFRRHQKLTQDECDRGLISASDFTAMLTKLPSNNYTEEQLNEELKKFCKQISNFDVGQEFEIVKINIAYNISEYIQLIRKKSELEKKFQTFEAYFLHNKSFPENVTAETQKQLSEEIAQLQMKLDNIDNNVQQKNFNQTTQVAFVTFQTRSQLESLLQYTRLTEWKKVWIPLLQLFGKNYQKGFYFKEKLIHFIRAPEPDDIFWENCGYNLQYKLKQRCYSWVITGILLIVSFFILFGLDQVQNNFLNQQNINYVLLTFLSLVISMIISIINGAIYFSITNLGQKEKHYTKTHYDVSVATKLIYVQFINSALLILATNIIVQGLSNQSELRKDIALQRLSFSRPGGVASDAFVITIFNAIFTPLMSFFDVFYLIRLVKQRNLKNTSINTLTQLEANMIYEGPQVLLYDNYSYVIKTIWITIFFAPLVPISLLFCIFGLVSYYWVQKYLLLRRKCRPPLQSSQLNTEMSNLINFSPILIAAGQLWIDYVFDSSTTTKIINFVSIGLAGLEFFIPFENLAKKFITWPDDPNKNIKYSEQQSELSSDYDRVNPITKQQAITSFVRQKQSNNDGINQNQNNQNTNFLQALKEYAQQGGEQRFLNQTSNRLRLIAHLKANQNSNNKTSVASKLVIQKNQEDQAKLLEQQNYLNKIQQIQSQIQQQGNVQNSESNLPIQYQTNQVQYQNITTNQHQNQQQPFMNQQQQNQQNVLYQNNMYNQQQIISQNQQQQSYIQQNQYYQYQQPSQYQQYPQYPQNCQYQYSQQNYDNQFNYKVNNNF